jgi:tRNA(Ile)-lysidine synthase TilS/MesJ
MMHNKLGVFKSSLIYISRTCLPKCFSTQAGIPLIKTQISQNINNWFRDICEICGIICAYLREAFKDFLNSPWVL